MMAKAAVGMEGLLRGVGRDWLACLLRLGVIAAVLTFAVSISTPADVLAQDAPSFLDEMSAEDRAAWEEQQEWMAEQGNEHLRQMEAFRQELQESLTELDPESRDIADGAGESTPTASGEEQRPVTRVIEATPGGISIGERTRQIQTVLRDAGCYTGNIDGAWGPRSRAAATSFAERTGLTLPDEPSRDMLVILNEAVPQGRVCPPTCNARQELRDGRCVTKTCASGQRLTRDGRCVAVQAATSNTCPEGARRIQGQCRVFKNGQWCQMGLRYNARTCSNLRRGIQEGFLGREQATAQYNCYCR